MAQTGASTLAGLTAGIQSDTINQDRGLAGLAGDIQDAGKSELNQVVGRSLVSPFAKTGMMLGQASGLMSDKDIQAAGDELIKWAGATETGEQQQGTFLEEMPANIALGLAGGGAFNVTKAGLSGIMKNQAKSMLAKSVTPGRKLLTGVGELATENVLPTAIDLYQTKYTETGETETAVPTLKDAAVTYGANLLADTGITIGVGQLVKSGLKFRHDAKMNKQMAEVNNSFLNLDSDGIASINKTIYGESDEISPSGFVESKLDGIDAEGAFIDPNTNQFLIKTDALGTIRGTVDESGKLIIDNKASDIKTDALSMMYGESRLISPLTKEQQAAYKLYTEEAIEGVDTKPKEYSLNKAVDIQPDGKVEINTKAKETISRQYGEEGLQAEQILRQQMEDTITALEQAKVTRYGNGDEIKSTNAINIEPDITAQVLLAKKIDRPDVLLNGFNENFIKLFNYVNSFNSKYRVSDSVGGNFESFKVPNKKAEAELYDPFFKRSTDADGYEHYTAFKPEFLKALDVAFALSVAKKRNLNGNVIDTNNLSRELVSTAMDLIGAKPGKVRSGHVRELVRNTIEPRVANNLQAGIKNFTENDIAFKPIDNGVEIETKYRQEINQMINKLGTDPMSVETTISQGLNNGITDWGKGLSFVERTINQNDVKNGTSKVVRDDYGITQNDQTKLEAAIAQANKKFVFNEDRYSELTKIMEMSDNEIYQLYGKIDTPDKSVHVSLKDNIKQFANDVRQEIANLQEMHDKGYTQSGGIYFDVMVNNNGRIQYQALTNPQSSKLAMMVLQESETGNISVRDAKGNIDTNMAEALKRAVLTNYGEKPEYMTAKQVDDAFLELYENGQIKKDLWYEEGVISYLGRKDAADVYDVLINGADKKINFVTEIDGKVNGIAIKYALIGKSNPMLGIGGYLQDAPKGKDGKPLDPYTMYLDFFNEEMRFEKGAIERSDVKPVVTGNTYDMGPYAAAHTMGETVFNKLLLMSNSERKAALSADTQGIARPIMETVNLVKPLYEKLPDSIKGKVNRFNALKEYLDAIMKNPELKADHLRDYKSFANMKSELLEELVDIANKMDIRNKNVFNNNTADLVMAIDNLRNNKRLTDAQKYAFVNEYSSKVKTPVENALDKLYSDPLMKKYNKYLGETLYELQKGFSVLYTNKKAFGYDDIHQSVLPDLMRNVNKNVSEADIKYIQDKFVNQYTVKSNTFSLKDAVDFMAQHGYMSETVVHSKYFRDITPKIKVFGKEMPLVKFEGYAGYDSNLKANYNAPSTIQVASPIFNIAHDASIMDAIITQQAGVISKFDAVVSNNPTYAMEAAKIGNRELKRIYQYENPINSLVEALDDMAVRIKDIQDMSEGQRFIATQELMKANKPATADAVKAKMNDVDLSVLKGYDKYDNLTKTLKDMKDEIDTNKANSDMTVIDQYSNGNKSVANNSHTDAPEIHTVNQEPIVTYNRNLDYLKDVEATKGTIAFIKTEGVDSADAIYQDIPVSFEPGKQSSFTDNKIVIGVEGKNGVANEHILHELSHRVFNDMSEKFDKLNDAIKKVMADGLTLKDGTPIYSLNTASISNDEAFAGIFGKLLNNEAIMDNPGSFAKVFSKKDLTGDIEPLMFRGQEVTTVKQLEKIMKGLGYDDMPSLSAQFKDAKVNIMSAYNSNVAVKNWLNNFEAKEFSPTVKETIGNIKSSRKLIAEVNNKIKEMPYLELFLIDKSREALEKALSLKQGGDNLLQSMSANYREMIQSGIDKIGIEGLSLEMGRFKNLGGTVFLDAFKTARNYDEFLSIISDQVISKRRQMAKHLEGIEKAEIKSLIRKYTEALAVGKVADRYKAYEFNLNRITDDILFKMYPDDVNKRINAKGMMRDYLKQEAAYYRLTGKKEGTFHEYARGVKKIFDMLQSQSDKDVVIDLYTIDAKYDNPNDLFGANPEFNLRNSGYRLKAIKASDYSESMGKIAAVTEINGEKFYGISSPDNALIVGKQDSQIFEIDANWYEKGLYETTVDRTKVIFNPQNIVAHKDIIDLDFVTMSGRNFFLKQKTDIGADILSGQVNLLKKEGFLLSKSEIDALRKSEADLPFEQRQNLADNYIELSDNNPITQLLGKHYISKGYAHYFEGSEGINLRKAANAIFHDPKISNMIADWAGFVHGVIQAGRTLILTTRASSYINSAVSSASIYMFHADNPLKFKQDIQMAKKLTDQYRKLIRDYSQGKIDISELEAHPLHNAMIHGISTTIRSDAYRTGTYGENYAITFLSRAFGKDIGDRLAAFSLDPKTDWGRNIGEVYDATEIYPKIALYLAKKRELGSEDLAVQSVLMAFPTYNNLNPLLNAIDQVSPYTKFMASWPKMLMYTINQNPTRFAIAGSALAALPRMTVSADDEQEMAMYERGFLKVPFTDNSYWYYQSANPYLPPSKTFTTDSPEDLNLLSHIMNVGFAGDIAGAIGDINPITSGWK